MRDVFTKFTNLVYRWLASTKFFIATLVLFCAHSLWLALSASSLPYDEIYHMGIIDFYSHQWSPFIANQPASVSYLGDITRLSSYLFHYLMSFPYRLLENFTSSDYLLTISMRFINIAMVVAGIILFRKLLLKIGFSRRVTHLALFVFSFLPIIVVLSAEVNYDNLMFLLAPIFFIFTVNLVRSKITAQNIVGYISVGLLACLAKNQFLVVFGLVSIGVIYFIIKRTGWSQFNKKLKTNINKTSWIKLAGLAVLLVISIGLFSERYGLNFVRYHSVRPDCQKVQSFEVCKYYSPWIRNHSVKTNLPSYKQFGNPISYTQHWISSVLRGSFPNYTNVPTETKDCKPECNYQFAKPLPLMKYTIFSVAAIVVAITLFSYKKWWAKPRLRTIILLCALYALALWFFNYRIYLHLGRPFATQFRYLLPVLILAFAAIIEVFKFYTSRRQPKATLALIVILIFVYSGGAFGWFIRARPDWYWPSQTIINTNQNIQSALQKTIIN